MKTKIFGLISALLLSAALAAACSPQAAPTSEPTLPAQPTAEAAGLPNPASVFCNDQGGRLDIRTDENGGQYGVCIFPDGSECEEWAYFRGECAPRTIEEAIQPTETETVPASAPAPTRLSFATGETELWVEGDLAAGQTLELPLRGVKGDWLMADLSSPDQAAVLAIRGEDGSQLLGSAANLTTWQGQLPTSQDYIFQLTSANASHYGLSIVVPERIQFKSGEISAQLQRTIGKNSVHDFIFNARKGQKVSIKLTSPNQDVLLTLYGVSDGQPLIRSASGASSFEGTLPGDQDYILKAVSSGEAEQFSLDLTIQ